MKASRELSPYRLPKELIKIFLDRENIAMTPRPPSRCCCCGMERTFQQKQFSSRKNKRMLHANIKFYDIFHINYSTKFTHSSHFENFIHTAFAKDPLSTAYPLLTPRFLRVDIFSLSPFNGEYFSPFYNLLRSSTNS